MKRAIVAIAASCLSLSGLVGCGPEKVIEPPPVTKKYDTADKINTYLDQKALVMEGDLIPSHPNGFSKDAKLGANSQCYKKVTMNIAAGIYNVKSLVGKTDTGVCDISTTTELNFTSAAALLENVQGNGECFDFTVTYNGFGQEGRGSITADGSQVALELFFKGQATGHRCADGAVGSPTVTLNGKAFTGNAVQKYTVTIPAT